MIIAGAVKGFHFDMLQMKLNRWLFTVRPMNLLAYKHLLVLN